MGYVRVKGIVVIETHWGIFRDKADSATWLDMNIGDNR